MDRKGRNRVQSHEYYLRNKEEIRDRSRRNWPRYLERLKHDRPEAYLARRKYNREYYQQHRTRLRANMNERARRLYAATRKRVLTYYGGGRMACVCCAEGINEFLSLDHENNDGNLERRDGKRRGGGVLLYRRLEIAGFPLGYRTLCFNCNSGRALTPDGRCPHEVLCDRPAIADILHIAEPATLPDAAGGSWGKAMWKPPNMLIRGRR